MSSGTFNVAHPQDNFLEYSQSLNSPSLSLKLNETIKKIAASHVTKKSESSVLKRGKWRESADT